MGQAMDVEVKYVEPGEFMDFKNIPQGHFLLDVRSKSEFQSGTLPGAVNIEVGNIKNQLNEIPRDKVIHIFCKTSVRAKIALSTLKSNGYKKFVMVGLFNGASDIAKAYNISLVKP